MIPLAIHWQYMMEQDGITGSKATMNFKEIHIDSLINQLFTESGIELFRICNIAKKVIGDLTKKLS